MGVTPNRDQVRALATDYSLVPIFEKIEAGGQTATDIFRKVRGVGEAFLLESVDTSGHQGRWSYIGVNPHEVFKWGLADGGDPYQLVQEKLQQFIYAPVEDLPPFSAGAVGYFSFDCVRSVEYLPDINQDPIGLPDVALMFTNAVIALDEVDEVITISAMVGIPTMSAQPILESVGATGIDSAFDSASEIIFDLKRLIQSNSTEPLVPVTGNHLRPSKQSDSHSAQSNLSNAEYGYSAQSKPSNVEHDYSAHNLSNVGHDRLDASPVQPTKKFNSNTTKDRFEEMVDRCIKYIKAGDAFQIVPSQRWEAEIGDLDPFAVYCAQREINPSPYMYFLDFGDFQVAGASPEPLLTVQGRQVSTRPIAGTRRRGATDSEDTQLAQELINDEKECAEHLMLVDLGRNDLGRVCEYGSIKVDSLMRIEKYSHVMHMVSDVSGQLRADISGLTALRAVLPAGTLSGAPKVRAMEIIDELEQVKRGVYGGAVGHFSYSGDLDVCIAIRTAVISQGKAYVQAGAGIVSDAIPEREYEESCIKAKSVMEAIVRAQSTPRPLMRRYKG